MGKGLLNRQKIEPKVRPVVQPVISSHRERVLLERLFRTDIPKAVRVIIYSVLASIGGVGLGAAGVGLYVAANDARPAKLPDDPAIPTKLDTDIGEADGVPTVSRTAMPGGGFSIEVSARSPDTASLAKILAASLQKELEKTAPDAGTSDGQ